MWAVAQQLPGNERIVGTSSRDNCASWSASETGQESISLRNLNCILTFYE